MPANHNPVTPRRKFIYDSWIQWWQNGIAIALSVSLILIGIGRIETETGAGSISAWSVSRTTFFFWLVLKVALLVRDRRAPRLVLPRAAIAPIYVFFLVVSSSLLPDFRAAGDYRYFAFACVHAVMVADVFTERRRLRLIVLALGILPGVLVVRGLVDNPAILSLDLAQRFAFPLDHPNTAGFIFFPDPSSRAVVRWNCQRVAPCASRNFLLLATCSIVVDVFADFLDCRDSIADRLCASEQALEIHDCYRPPNYDRCLRRACTA